MEALFWIVVVQVCSMGYLAYRVNAAEKSLRSLRGEFVRLQENLRIAVKLFTAGTPGLVPASARSPAEMAPPSHSETRLRSEIVEDDQAKTSVMSSRDVSVALRE